MKKSNKRRKDWYWLPERYGKMIKAIRDSSIKLWCVHKTHRSQLPGYTPHDESHARSVENIIHRLIPGSMFKKLSEKERFYLLASAWVHDIGMIIGIEEEDTPKNAEGIRTRHHDRAGHFIVNNFSQLDITQEDANALGLLAYSHGADINECPEKITVGNEVIRLRLLSSYLRIADMLDISESRSPTSNYAICLSYNIPLSTKLHWIKSRLISGIEIDPEEQKIIVEFKSPHDFFYDTVKDNYNIEQVKTNLERLRQTVLDDIKKELDSVKTVLIKGGISCFLTIESRQIKMSIDDQILPEILRLASYYEMINHPSATKLIMMVLQTLRDIIKPYIYYQKQPVNKNNNKYHISSNKQKVNSNSILEEVQRFIKETIQEMNRSRPCHAGLKKVMDIIKELSESNDLDIIYSEIELLIKQNKKEREDVRKTAECYFLNEYPGLDNNSCNNQCTKLLAYDNENTCWKLSSDIDLNKYKNLPAHTILKHKINILVYGYSELVVKALCGFRDVVIRKLLCECCCNKEMSISFHKNNLEVTASSLFRIFVCEGQPKTITAQNDALRYHDGTRYAIELNRRGFTNLIIIPDLIAGSILTSPTNNTNSNTIIDYVMLGMNGLEYDLQNLDMANFVHSSGHTAIAALNKHYGNIDDKYTKLILVLSSSKCIEKTEMARLADNITNSGKNLLEDENEVEGYKFWRSYLNEPVRLQPFLSRDEKLRKELFKADIRFYNPREDKVDLNIVDDIIGNGKYFTDMHNNNSVFFDWLTLQSIIQD